MTKEMSTRFGTAMGSSPGQTVRKAAPPGQPALSESAASPTATPESDVDIATTMLAALTPVTPTPAAEPLSPVIDEVVAGAGPGKYWLKGALVTVTPERVTIDFTGAKKPEGVAAQSELSLKLPTSNGELHLALVVAPDRTTDPAATAADPTQPVEERKESSDGVRMSHQQQPGEADDQKDDGGGAGV